MPNKDDSAEIYKRLNEMALTLARIDERTTRMDAEMSARNSDHENRLRSLEEKEARRGGIMTTLTAIGSALGAGITWVIHHFVGGGGS